MGVAELSPCSANDFAPKSIDPRPVEPSKIGDPRNNFCRIVIERSTWRSIFPPEPLLRLEVPAPTGRRHGYQAI